MKILKKLFVNEENFYFQLHKNQLVFKIYINDLNSYYGNIFQKKDAEFQSFLTFFDYFCKDQEEKKIFKIIIYKEKSQNEENIIQIIFPSSTENNNPTIYFNLVKIEKNTFHEKEVKELKQTINKLKTSVVKQTNSIENAAINGDLNEIIFLLKQGFLITPWSILKAVQHNHFHIVKYLCEHKKTEIDIWPSAWASADGYFPIIKYFVDQGFPIHPYAMAYAAKYGHINIVKYLIKQNMPIHEDVINWAAENGQLKVIKYLVEQKAPINKHALSLAAKSGHLPVVTYLVEKNIPISKNAIIWASENGHNEIVTYLKKYNTKLCIIL